MDDIAEENPADESCPVGKGSDRTSSSSSSAASLSFLEINKEEKERATAGLSLKTKGGEKKKRGPGRPPTTGEFVGRAKARERGGC